MFKTKPKYAKLRTNLRLAINRLKLLEKKKTELALKARREISDYIRAGKDDRARIRVEHIIREDYLVEAMEIIEMFCDLLLARFGLIDKMSELDPGLEEPIATLIWVAPRLYADIPEMKEIAIQFTAKYGKEYAAACRANTFEQVNDKVIQKMNIVAPPKKLVEHYMVEISKTYNVPFEPDPCILEDELSPHDLVDLIRLDENNKKNNNNGGGSGGDGGGGGGMTYPHHPTAGIPSQPAAAGYSPAGMYPQHHATTPGQYPPHLGPMQYPQSGGTGAMQYPHLHQVGTPRSPAPPYNQPTAPRLPDDSPPPGYHPASVNNQSSDHLMSTNVFNNVHNQTPSLPSYNDVFERKTTGCHQPPEQNLNATFEIPPSADGSRTGLNPNSGNADDNIYLPVLPDIPGTQSSLSGLPSVPNSSVAGRESTNSTDIDFDDLTKRFEQLKKKK